AKDNEMMKKAREVQGILQELHEKGKELGVLPIETYNMKLPRRRIAELLKWKANYQKKLNKMLESNPQLGYNIGFTEDIREFYDLQSKIANIDNRIKTSYKL